MFIKIKKWIMKHFWIGKPIQYEGRIYTILDVHQDYILVDTPYFAMNIQNEDIDKIKLLKINKEIEVGQTVMYYDQQTDQNRTGTITYIGQDGTMKLDDGYCAHVNFANKPKRQGMRRYRKGCIFKHQNRWYTIQNCFLTDKGLAYNCIGYDLLGHVFLEQDIKNFNKEF